MIHLSKLEFVRFYKRCANRTEWSAGSLLTCRPISDWLHSATARHPTNAQHLSDGAPHKQTGFCRGLCFSLFSLLYFSIARPAQRKWGISLISLYFLPWLLWQYNDNWIFLQSRCTFLHNCRGGTTKIGFFFNLAVLSFIIAAVVQRKLGFSSISLYFLS